MNGAPDVGAGRGLLVPLRGGFHGLRGGIAEDRLRARVRIDAVAADWLK